MHLLQLLLLATTVSINNSLSFYSALPKLSKIPSRPILVKYGGNAMTSPDLAVKFASDIRHLKSLGFKMIVVHGGGPMINGLLKELNVQSSFDEETGVRVSDEKVVDCAEKALSSVGKGLAASISKDGVMGVSISGRDASLLRCVAKDVRLGNVGEVKEVNADFLTKLLEIENVVPIVCPIGCGLNDSDETVYNVNADTAAGAIAKAMNCDLTMFLTDIKGVCDEDMNLLPKLNKADIDKLIETNVITGGMIPKVSYALQAVQGDGVAMICDGRVENAVAREVHRIYGEGGGSGGGSDESGGTIVCE
ncbi:hypothetical protein TrLO_g11984 [Triparma laevis f. longispina]|uniref:acetylglutamate kinase n=1 Tax=Triparma laevis f. longispina TaxID=1714387 RepID=A0A9W7CAN4_9STRA|nr:hypothetical protein TrLO_g11984 [Triparma laevis f. longispina]